MALKVNGYPDRTFGETVTRSRSKDHTPHRKATYYMQSNEARNKPTCILEKPNKHYTNTWLNEGVQLFRARLSYFPTPKGQITVIGRHRYKNRNISQQRKRSETPYFSHLLCCLFILSPETQQPFTLNLMWPSRQQCGHW